MPCLQAQGSALSPEHAQRVLLGDIVLPLRALPREDVSKDVVSAVAGHAVCGRGVAGHILGAWVAHEAVQVVGQDVGVLKAIGALILQGMAGTPVRQPARVRMVQALLQP